MRLIAADLAMQKSNFVFVSMDDVTSVTSHAVALIETIIIMSSTGIP